MTEKSSPVLTQDIPDQIFYAGIKGNALNLNDFIANAHDSDGALNFYVTLADGEPLPSGIFCQLDGVFNGQPDYSGINATPYSILVVAKNDADIPLIAYFNLMIVEATQEVLTSRGLSTQDAVFMAEGGDDSSESLVDMAIDAAAVDEEQSDDFSSVDKEFEDFLESLSADDIVNDPTLAERALGGSLRFSGELNDPEYLAFVIRYLIRKFSSLQLYNADEIFSELNIVDIYDASTGWKVYDSTVALTTTNPRPFSSDLSRSEFIATIKEMIVLAAQRGWKTVGVKGCDRELGYRLVAEYNQVAEQQLQLDNYMEFSSWRDRAETQRFAKNYESRR